MHGLKIVVQSSDLDVHVYIYILNMLMFDVRITSISSQIKSKELMNVLHILKRSSSYLHRFTCVSRIITLFSELYKVKFGLSKGRSSLVRWTVDSKPYLYCD